jgi:hypothetical protein
VPDDVTGRKQLVGEIVEVIYPVSSDGRPYLVRTSLIYFGRAERHPAFANHGARLSDDPAEPAPEAELADELGALREALKRPPVRAALNLPPLEAS